MVNEAYASGELNTREEALALVQRKLSLRVHHSNPSQMEVR
jgi:hypothetical protein